MSSSGSGLTSSPVPATTPGTPTSTGLPGSRPGGSSGTATPDASTEWPVQLADVIVNAVDSIRDKTTGPIQTAARGIVYGLLAAVLGLIVTVLVIVGLVRLLDAVLPWGNIWLPYLIMGSLLTGAGLFVFARRRVPGV